MSEEKQQNKIMSRAMELLEQSQKIARIGAWEWIAGEQNIFWTNEMFGLLELERTPDNMVPVECLYQYLHPEEKEHANDILSQLNELQTIELNHRWVTSSGKVIYMHCWCECIYNTPGQLSKIRGTCQDISFLKEMEDELERKNDMLQQAETTAKLASWKYNFKTDKIYYSDSFQRFFSDTNTNLLNSPEEVFQKVLPEDIDKLKTAYNLAIKERKDTAISFRTKEPDGSIKYFSSIGRLSTNRKGDAVIIGTIQDVTEQYLLNRQLSEQTDFVQKLVDSSVNGVLVLDSTEKYVLWNKKCEELFGLTKEEVIGKTPSQVSEGNDISWFKAAVAKALSGVSVKIDEMPPLQDDKFFEMNLIPLRNTEGVINHVFILIHDITELKQLNNELRKQKEFAEAVIDNSEACIFVFDTEFRLIDWNEKCTNIYGIDCSDVIGKQLEEIFPGIDLGETQQRLEKAMEGVTIHYPETHSYVLEKIFDSYVIPMKDADGNVFSILCVLNDVTEIISISNRVREANRLLEQKKNELSERNNFLETLLNTSIDFIGAYDLDLNLIEINKATLEVYGLEKAGIIGKSIHEIFPGIEITQQYANLQKALRDEPTYYQETTSLFGNRTLLASQIPLKNNGEIIGVLAISSDISNIKQAMQELEDLNDQLASKNQELNRINSELTSFSYVASHDLQEPLRKIQAFISLILARDGANLSETTQDYFKRIQASANRMQQMIDGLLSFSRTNTTPKTSEEKHIDAIIKNAIRQLQDQVINKKAIINIDTPHTISIIPHQFEQLLEQLISNAIKFQKEDKVPVINITSNLVTGKEIEGEVARKDMMYCRISISDNGIGFEMENAEKIFQMFQRLHGKSEYSGTGIGLAICRRIAQNHDGFITTFSTPGVGSVFNVFIPLEKHKTLLSLPRFE